MRDGGLKGLASLFRLADSHEVKAGLSIVSLLADNSSSHNLTLSLVSDDHPTRICVYVCVSFVSQADTVSTSSRP